MTREQTSKTSPRMTREQTNRKMREQRILGGLALACAVAAGLASRIDGMGDMLIAGIILAVISAPLLVSRSLWIV